jgi:hypothetical protein
MAEINAERWQNLQRQMAFEIGAAFRELAERWHGIFDQKAAQTYQAGKEWQLAQTQEGRLSWEPYPKSLETAVEELRAVVADLGTLPSWATYNPEPDPTLAEQQAYEDRPYDEMEDLAHGTRELLQDEERLADRIVVLQDRIDALEKEHLRLEHAQEMAGGRQQEQGMGY